jgi:beta-phosphoglucomutase
MPTTVFSSQLRAVVFDLDGTLLDSMPGHVAAWQTAFAEIGLRIEADFFFLHEGMLDWTRLAPKLNGTGVRVDAAGFEAITRRQRRLYLDRHAAASLIFPEAARLVDRLKGRVRLAVVTSSERSVLPPNLWGWLEDRFDQVVTRDQVRRGKPHPEPFLTALDRLRVEAGQAVAVENAPAGIRSAKAAGLWTLALATTLDPIHLADADQVLANHQALEDWFGEQGW